MKQRPSKAEGIFGVVFGLIFVCIGLFAVIPVAGPFGILWTLLAVGVTFYNAYMAFGKKNPEPQIPVEEPDSAENCPKEL